MSPLSISFQLCRWYLSLFSHTHTHTHTHTHIYWNTILCHWWVTNQKMFLIYTYYSKWQEFQYVTMKMKRYWGEKQKKLTRTAWNGGNCSRIAFVSCSLPSSFLWPTPMTWLPLADPDNTGTIVWTVKVYGRTTYCNPIVCITYCDMGKKTRRFLDQRFLSLFVFPQRKIINFIVKIF